MTAAGPDAGRELRPTAWRSVQGGANPYLLMVLSVIHAGLRALRAVNHNICKYTFYYN